MTQRPSDSGTPLVEGETSSIDRDWELLVRDHQNGSIESFRSTFNGILETKAQIKKVESTDRSDAGGVAKLSDAAHLVIDSSDVRHLQEIVARLARLVYHAGDLVSPLLSSFGGDNDALDRIPAGACLTTGDLAERYVEILANSLEFDCCSLFLWDDSRERLAMVASKGYNHAFAHHIYAVGEKALTLRIAKHGETITGDRETLKRDYPADFSDRCKYFIREGKLRNFLGLPLTLDGTVIGVAKLENKKRVRRFTGIPGFDEQIARSICKLFVADLSNVQACFVKTQSKNMVDLLTDCRRYAESCRDPIVIAGPAGVGKQLLARLIHHQSPSQGNLFRHIGCREIQSNHDISSMITAYVGGLADGKDGLSTLIQNTAGGTLYFDDLAGLTPDAQASFPGILDSLEDHQTVRIIVSVPFCLDDPEAKSNLEDSLRARLFGRTIKMPLLSERRGDIELLVRHFAEELYFRKGRGQPPDLVKAELKHDDFVAQFSRTLTDHPGSPQVQTLREIVEKACTRRKSMSEVLARERGADDNFLRLDKAGRDERVRELFDEKMVKDDWTGKQLAQHLGINHRTLQKYFTDLGLRSPRSKKRNQGG